MKQIRLPRDIAVAAFRSLIRTLQEQIAAAPRAANIGDLTKKLEQAQQVLAGIRTDDIPETIGHAELLESAGPHDGLVTHAAWRLYIAVHRQARVARSTLLIEALTQRVLEEIARSGDAPLDHVVASAVLNNIAALTPEDQVRLLLEVSYFAHLINVTGGLWSKCRTYRRLFDQVLRVALGDLVLPRVMEQQ